MSTVGPRIPYLRKEATVASMMGNVLLAQAGGRSSTLLPRALRLLPFAAPTRFFNISRRRRAVIRCLRTCTARSCRRPRQ